MPVLRAGWLPPKKREKRENRISKARFTYDAEKAKRQIVFNFADNPYLFANAMFNDLKERVDKLDEMIDVLGDDISVDLLRLRDQYREDLIKYSDVVFAFDNDDRNMLSQYRIVYTPSGNGNIMDMDILSFHESHKNSHDANLEFAPSGEKGTKGETIIKTQRADGSGMRLMLVKANPQMDDTIKFAGTEFNFDGFDFYTRSPEKFRSDFIRRESSLYRQPGQFVQDSTGKLYYINSDKSLSEMVNKEWFDLMGGKPEEIYKLDPYEEENLLGRELSLPDPIFQYLENKRTEREETIPEHSAFQTLKNSWQEGGRQIIRGIRDFMLRDVPDRPVKPLFPPDKKWGLEGIDIPKHMEEAKKRWGEIR